MPASSDPAKTPHRRQALEGVKVLDFGWAIAGALTGKFLADHGATVIRLESSQRPDLTRLDRSLSSGSKTSYDDKPFFAYLNSSKRSLVLDLKHARAKEILDRLIGWADVVNENFTPGTMARLGLGYEYMSTVRPDIIYASASIFGQTGPLAHEAGVDGTGAATSGRLSLTGWPDRIPITPGSAVYGDYLMPMVTTSAIVAALIHRRRTGRGQYLETSMYELSAHQISPAILDWQLNGVHTQRTGNRSDRAAPHGVYPCAGDDRWCAITVFDQAEWEALLSVAPPEWASDPRFSTLESRKANEDELDAMISRWTAEQPAEQLFTMLQAAGVPAGVVQDAEDLLDKDPHLAARDFLPEVGHHVLGPFAHQPPPFRLSGTPAWLKPAPRLGQDNEFITRDLLDYSDEEYIELVLQEVFR